MHVGITRELKDDVSSRIRNHFRRKAYQLEFGCDSISQTYTLPRDHSIIPRIIWGEHEHLLALMPKEWCKRLTGDFALRVQTKVPGQENFCSVRINVKNNTELVAPPGFDHYREHTIPYDLCPEIQKYFDLHVREQAFEAQWNRINHDVREFLKSNKSLNAAVKAWPELRAYIPSEYLERVDKKPERKAQQEKAAQVLANIDRDGAVAAATMVTLAA
jgi:hypothetical protein